MRGFRRFGRRLRRMLWGLFRSIRRSHHKGRLFILFLLGTLVLVSVIVWASDRRRMPPSLDQAPVIARTVNRYYYAQKATETRPGVYLLKGYWSWEGGRWRFYPGELVLDPAVYGPLQVRPRSSDSTP